MCNWCEFHNGEDVDTDWVDDNTRKPGKYNEEDAAEETGSSSSKTEEAWHEAREHAQEDGELPERATNKNDDED